MITHHHPLRFPFFISRSYVSSGKRIFVPFAISQFRLGHCVKKQLLHRSAIMYVTLCSRLLISQEMDDFMFPSYYMKVSNCLRYSHSILEPSRVSSSPLVSLKMIRLFKGSMPKKKVLVEGDEASHPSLIFFPSAPSNKTSVVVSCSVLVFVVLSCLIVDSSAKPIILQQGNNRHHPDQMSYFRKVAFKRNSTRRANDGTSLPGEYYQIDDMLFLNKSKRDRAGQYRDSYRWPNGRIPFTFAPGYSEDEMRAIFFTMKYIEHYTCVRFAFRTERDENYLFIRNVEGKCQSFVGNVCRGAQQVALDPDSRSCAVPNFPGHVLHELIHALGFFHEHARDDRDNYIEIVYDNLSEDDDILRNFYKNSDSDKQVDFYGVPYNYGSIMHYSEKAGSTNGEPTIIRRTPLPQGIPKPLDGEMGQRERLTEGDTQMLRNMYKDICSAQQVMVSHGRLPQKFPDVVDWVAENDIGTEIHFPIESTDDDDDDDDDYDNIQGSINKNTI